MNWTLDYRILITYYKRHDVKNEKTLCTKTETLSLVSSCLYVHIYFFFHMLMQQFFARMLRRK